MAVFESEERVSHVQPKAYIDLQRIMHEFDPLSIHGWFVHDRKYVWPKLPLTCISSRSYLSFQDPLF